MQKKQIWHRYKTNEQSTVSGRKRENIKLLNPSLVLKYFQHKVKHLSTSKILAKSGQDQISPLSFFAFAPLPLILSIFL